MIQRCQNEDDYMRLLADSHTGPVLLLKHSTRCPISAGAQAQYQQFAEMHPEVECWQVLVIEQRALSMHIAEQTGITHQSPQVMLFQHGKPIWHASHHEIRVATLGAALQ